MNSWTLYWMNLKKTVFIDTQFLQRIRWVKKGGVAKLFFASSGFLDVIRNSEMVNQIVCMMHRHTPALRSLFSRSEI